MPTLYNTVHTAVNSFCTYKVYVLRGDRQGVRSHLTQCWVVIVFWKIKRIRGWGGCSFKIRWSRGSFWGGDIWTESCHYFYYTKYWGLIIIFGAMGFSEVSLQRFWLIDLKDLLRSWDFGDCDLLRQWSSLLWFGALFLTVSFPAAEQEERWSCGWPLGFASKRTEHLPALQVCV